MKIPSLQVIGNVMSIKSLHQVLPSEAGSSDLVATIIVRYWDSPLRRNDTAVKFFLYF